jgi:hypothetical protein
MSPALCSVSGVEEGLDVVELLHEMKDHLIADFGFQDAKLAGDDHLNRTTEPLLRFLVWLKRTPEAQAALQLTFQRVTSKPRP